MWHDHLPGLDIVPEIGYSTSFYTMQAVKRIEDRNTSRPFWLHLAYQAVHGGAFRSSPPAQDMLPNTTSFRDRGYGSALHSLDNGIKNLTAALRSKGMWDNTILMLSADNGGDNPVGKASNYPLVGRKCLSWEGGTRVFAFVSGGLVPPSLRGTTNNQLMHISDWYTTFTVMAGVDPRDDWKDPTTNITHPIDGINVWPALMSGKAAARLLPTTHKSLLHDDGSGKHMWKLIQGNETRADRFHANGSVYEDPYNLCLPGDVNGSYGIQYDCHNSLGQNGGGGRMSCIVCSDDRPCLFDVIADPGETKNLASILPEMVTTMKAQLAKYTVYVPPLSQGNLDCYDCAFNQTEVWSGFPGPGCRTKKP